VAGCAGFVGNGVKQAKAVAIDMIIELLQVSLLADRISRDERPDKLVRMQTEIDAACGFSLIWSCCSRARCARSVIATARKVGFT
jgi:hypothetical protein